MSGVDIDAVGQRLTGMSRQPRPLSPHDDFEEHTNQTNTESDILTLQAETVLALPQEGEVKIAVPAYESFTTDGTGGNTETFTLSHDLIDTPNTQSLVLWENGTLVKPDSIDYANNSIDYTDDGTSNTLHVYYVPGDAATVRMEKRLPGGKTSGSEELYSGQLALTHQSDQQEDSEKIRLTDSWLERYLATDMVLAVTIDAPYTVKFSEDTDGTRANNALFHFEAEQGNGSANGLLAAIREDIGSR